jgi:hypothetical protein
METIGWVLSASGFCLIVLSMVDLWKRGGRVPGLRGKRSGLLGRWQSSLWVVTLFAGYCAGDRVTIYSRSTLNGVRVRGPLTIETKSIEAANPGAVRSTGWGVTNLPFYQANWSVVNFADDRPLRRVENQGLVVPWVFFVVVLAYWFAARRERIQAMQP